MYFKTSYLTAAVLLFSMSSGAANAASAQDIIQDYSTIKAKTDSGEKVRVIAWLKNGQNTTSLQGKNSKPNNLAGIDKDNKAVSLARAKLSSMGVTAKRELPHMGAMVLEADSHQLNLLVKSGVIDKIEEDTLHKPTLRASIERIGADLAQADGFVAANQAIVIMDTGVERTHRFIREKIVEEACFSTNSTYATSLCPNGEETMFGDTAATDCYTTGREISGCDHGTHVAGIAAGYTYHSQPINGVASFAKIVAVQVFSEFPASFEACGGSPCILSYKSDQMAALEWVLNDATTQNIAAVNLSLGGGKHTGPCDSDSRAPLIDSLRDAGIATVVSSGNDGYKDAVGEPGCISSAITVGASYKYDDVHIPPYSNSSTLVDFLAPGDGILSSVRRDSFNFKSGTSMSAPHVAGAFALMREANPHARVQDIEDYLKRYGVGITDRYNDLTIPRVAVYDAIKSFDVKPIAVIDDEIPRSVIVNRSVQYSATQSSEPAGQPLSYIWDFGDNSGEQVTTSSSISHTFTKMGSHEVSLKVNNGSHDSEVDNKATVTVYDPAVISIITSHIL